MIRTSEDFSSIGVPVLHCAKCGSKLDIYKGGGIWTVFCPSCNAEISLDGRRHDLYDAYEAYTKAIQSGSIGTAQGGRQSGRATTSSGTRKRRRRGFSSKVQSVDKIRELISEEGIDLEDLPDEIQTLLSAGRDYLVTYKHFPTSEAEYGAELEELRIPTRLKEHLISKGIERLYQFQTEAYHAIQNGEDVVIAAPTAQGKTEAFILPIIRQLLLSAQESFGNPGVRALLIYPTKALARDQYEKIQRMCEESTLTVGIFDGDVGQHERRKIYARPPDILLTNPDVLHYHLGWNRSRLIPILRTVQYVVLDEIHLYTGSMGSNVYYILRRLALESGEFQQIGASATVSNPKEFAEQVFDSEVRLVESDSAKRGPIHFMMYYPGDRSKYSMIVDIVGMLQRGGFKTLVFGNTHSEAEVLNMLINEQGMKSRVHRAGLPKKYRNQVEEQFRSGDLPVIVSTPTLELGIDIGDLDSVVSMIVSITRLTQRIGRAGRKGQESVAVLALRENDPISSFYRYRPEKYFTDIDAAYMEPDNEVVGYYQLIAAAMSGKLSTDTFPRQRKILSRLEAEGIIGISGDGAVTVIDHQRAQREWRGYSIRGIGDTVQIKSGKKTLGERNMPMAAQELHPGAIYLHGGKNYKSIEFDYTKGLGRATVVPYRDRSIHTRPLYSTMPRIVEVHEEQDLLGLKVIYCTLEMTQTVDGYVTKETRSGRVISHNQLDLPLEYSYLTRGFAFKSPEPVKSINEYLGGKLSHLEGDRMGPPELYGGSFHAFEHVLIESSDMLTGGSTREIGGVSMGDSGIIFVYDGSPGGNGASKLLFGRLQEAFERTETILAKCDCKTVDGCPLCTYSYQCGNNNKPLFRYGALDAVRQVLAGTETSVDTKTYRRYEPLV
ncbi:DEAD/DEAH box helicase [Candidatus Thorarchaeota archaeon]|nr:MAG: DEAD/DEAH box helicase [Candidatus Thorarchaeota archaeon]